jgi:hypothetical protein
MSEDPFERDLRTMLARRDPGPAPATLLHRVEAEREGAPRRLGRLPTGLIWLASAGLTAVVAVALVMALGQRPAPIGPGASPAPVTSGATLQAGDGAADGSFVPLAQGALGVIVLSVLVRVVLTSSYRPLTVAATLAAVGVVWIALNISNSDALVHEGGVSGVDPPSAEQDDQPGTFLGVRGNMPFHVFLTVTNTSRWPLELKGFVPVPVQSDLPQLGPRFVALGFYPTVPPALPEAAPPFRSTVLAPGGMVDLVLLGMAGDCALPVPPIRPSGETGGGFSSITSVRLVYDQLTMIHTEDVVLRDAVNIWWPDQCPADLASPSPGASPSPTP